MGGRALYVEWEDYAAAWIRNLIQRGLVCPGDVYCGDMRDVHPRDLERYNQVHLFAGIAVWSYGLRRAGVPDSANIWTFSEPCQPFSAAGKGLGFADERYLRPYTHHLVSQCRPAICLGEQVSSADGLSWLDVVQSDMENAGYAGGALDSCSAGVGAPHIRQRLRFAYASDEWLADAQEQRHSWINGEPDDRSSLEPQRSGVDCSLADSYINGSQRGAVETLLGKGWRLKGDAPRRGGGSLVSELAEAYGGRIGHSDAQRGGQQRLDTQDDGSMWGGRGGFGHNGGPELARPGPTNGFWSDADWLFCRDGKWRPVEPGTFPLAHGLPRSIRTSSPGVQRLASLAGLDDASLARAKAYRTGSLKAYGNAVDAEATTEFCRAVKEVFGL